MFEQVERQTQAPVVAVGTQAAADLLVATMAVNGVDATTTLASVYPSVDWAEGVVVSVASHDVDRACRLLRDLGHEPAPPT